MKFLVCVDGSLPGRNAANKVLSMVNPGDSLLFLNVYPPYPRPQHHESSSTNANTITNIIIELISGIPEYVESEDPYKQMKLSDKKKSEALKEFSMLKNMLKNQNLGSNCEVHYLLVASNDVSDTIIKVAEKMSVDTIVVGSRGLGLKRLLIGSVSSQVLQMSNCSVLIVR
eukprot:gene2515-3113_t